MTNFKAGKSSTSNGELNCQWADQLCIKFINIISETIAKNGVCNIMLTGGRSARKFYCLLNKYLYSLRELNHLNFFFTDERCVHPNNKESNYRLVIDSLFPNLLVEAMQIHRIEAESLDLLAACNRYNSILPKSIDLLILSVGKDGHIASLFPHRNLMYEKFRKVIHVKGLNQHLDRITVTPVVIQSANHVFVLAIGQEKHVVYDSALLEPDNIDAIPARLVLDRTWIFGEW